VLLLLPTRQHRRRSTRSIVRPVRTVQTVRPVQYFYLPPMTDIKGELSFPNSKIIILYKLNPLHRRHNLIVYLPTLMMLVKRNLLVMDNYQRRRVPASFDSRCFDSCSGVRQQQQRISLQALVARIQVGGQMTSCDSFNSTGAACRHAYLYLYLFFGEAVSSQR